LCPNEEEEFMQIMKVQIPSKQVFRAPTSRPNIAYSVVEYEADVEELAAVQELVNQKLEQYPAPAKIIIYSSNIDTIDEIGAELGCHIYHASIGSPETKGRIQERWERADGRVVVASNAFGLGIDQPDVRAVIHVGPIFQMRNYGQESGRAGRDGQPSEAVIMVGVGQQEALQSHHARLRRQPVVHRAVITDADKKRVEREKVDRFISGAQCRRIDLDREMDGRVDRGGCEEGEERCDVCRKSDAMMEEAEALQQAYMAEQEKERCQQERALDSGIGIPSSQSVIPPSSPPIVRSTVVQSSSPLVVRSHAFPSSPLDAFPSSADLPQLSRFPNNPSRSLASHIISSDPGFEMDMIAIVEEVDFQSQQMQYKRDQAYAQSQAQEESRAVWELEQELEEWVGRCAVCFIRGFPESRHSIIDCVEEGAEEVREDWFRMRKRMRDEKIFAAYSCCYNCHVPQAICSKWVPENGKWRSLAQGKCQFEGIIMPLVISGIAEGTDQIYDMIREQMEGSGIKFGEWEEMYKWFGQKEEWGGIEVSRLVQMFYRIVKDL
jgi:hypothetical protein